MQYFRFILLLVLSSLTALRLPAQAVEELEHSTAEVDNLLDNAFKFSPPGAGVRVVAKIDRGTILFGVQDEGVGLLPDQINQVFERFYQVDGSTTRRFGGMGIGLALCHEIVEAHGGRIWAESDGQGQGSTFWCALPLTAS